MSFYVDSTGRVPRGLTTTDGAQALNVVLLTAIVLGHGGTLEVGGLGDAEKVGRLLSEYELKVEGRGDGTILLTALRKPDPDAE